MVIKQRGVYVLCVLCVPEAVISCKRMKKDKKERTQSKWMETAEGFGRTAFREGRGLGPEYSGGGSVGDAQSASLFSIPLHAGGRKHGGTGYGVRQLAAG